MKPAFQKLMSKRCKNLGIKSKNLKSYWCPLSPLHSDTSYIKQVQSREYLIREKDVGRQSHSCLLNSIYCLNQAAAAPQEDVHLL